MQALLRAHAGLSAVAVEKDINTVQIVARQPCTPGCSHSLPTPSTSSSTQSCRLRHAPQRAARAAVITHGWFVSQSTRKLWDYKGSCVRQLSLQELQLLHRLSFGHRNQRSYLIILYKSDSPACQAFEQEVERLASGLRHERGFVAAALDVSPSDATYFASSMLGISSVPAVLLYPEAARGCLKFLGPDMSATGMLTAINNARQKALPSTANSPGAAEWQLVEAATPLAVTALRAAALTGNKEAVVATLQQQVQPLQPTPLAVGQASSYWSQGRVMFWGGVMLCSLLFVAWDLKLADTWEDWCLARRQAARTRGKKFTVQENLDDMFTLIMGGMQKKFVEADRVFEAGASDGQQQQQGQQQQGQQQQGQQPVQGKHTAGQAQAQQDQLQHQRASVFTGGQQPAGPQPPSSWQQRRQQQQQDLAMKQQSTGDWVVDQSAQQSH